MVRQDLTGQRFGMLVVNSFHSTHRTPSGQWKALWNVTCDCGGTKIVQGPNLKAGNTASCGCQERGVGRSWAHKGRPTWLSKMYTQYKGGAEKRGLEFNLDLNAVQALAEQHCHYCGSEPRSGIDRMDSTEGYNIWNCVPCCATCNRMKMSLSYDLFLAQVKRIAAHVK